MLKCVRTAVIRLPLSVGPETGSPETARLFVCSALITRAAYLSGSQLVQRSSGTQRFSLTFQKCSFRSGVYCFVNKNMCSATAVPRVGVAHTPLSRNFLTHFHPPPLPQPPHKSERKSHTGWSSPPCFTARATSLRNTNPGVYK